jgi:tRNA threonylcarbamoyladenosine biosynthesis protein TsaB
MIVLGIDSATDNLGIGLACDGKIIGETLLESRREHASHIIGIIDKTMAQSSLSRTDLNGIGVAIGPGSFTGLRIGLVVTKGLAVALDIPISGVSTFEVIAARLRCEFETFYLAASARRGEYYLCRISPECEVRESISLVEEQDFSDAVGNDPVGVIGPHPERLIESIETVIAPEKLYISGGELAVYAGQLLAEGKSDSVAYLEPLYIAPSQAERKFGRR